MASAAVTPRVRSMLVCHGIRSSKFGEAAHDLKGVHYAMTVARFPTAPSRLWLFLVLSSHRKGRFPGTVCILNNRTDRMIFMAHISPAPTFNEDEEFQFFRIPLRCRFREPGRYTVQIQFIRMASTDVVKGEMPFDVYTERGV